jgi:regulator-associated protein of mTOR
MIGNGDIHVLSGSPDDLSHLKAISSFLALDIRRSGMSPSNSFRPNTVASWWRQSGILGVGGRSDVVKIWDCPAERCFRVSSADQPISRLIVRQILLTEEEVPMTTIITEPVSGNLIVTGYANGRVKIYDIRQQRRTALMTWDDDVCQSKKVQAGQPVIKAGIVLGESSHVTSAWYVPCSA